MKPMNRTCLALVLSAVATGAAAADVADVRWSPSGEASHEFQVAPGKFAEWCTKLKQGDKVKWRFDAPAPLEFNVHYHEGKEVRFPSKMDGVAKAEGTLGVAVDQDYCWMWTNRSASPVAVRAALARSR